MDYGKRLASILDSSGWSQEQLARTLEVSFPTLNSWINGRSEPRAKAINRIQTLYLEIVGADDIDLNVLAQTKAEASKLKLTAKEMLSDTKNLDKLTLHLTYNTNTIEGSTMTLVDVEEVLFEHKVLTNRTAIEQAEHLRALDEALDGWEWNRGERRTERRHLRLVDTNHTERPAA